MNLILGTDARVADAVVFAVVVVVTELLLAPVVTVVVVVVKVLPWMVILTWSMLDVLDALVVGVWGEGEGEGEVQDVKSRSQV